MDHHRDDVQARGAAPRSAFKQVLPPQSEALLDMNKLSCAKIRYSMRG